ncbi:MAG: diacylglycerol/lipid kinase family protein [Candidatus Acidiferrales bacterium]
MPEGIHDAVIIYNPTSGRRRHRRLTELEAASAILRDAGIKAELAPTSGRGSATVLARQAVEQKRQLVIACGGDGTVNEVVNGLAGSHVPMALLPAGTANILAKELRIPWDLPVAARLIPGGTLRRIALGAILPHADASNEAQGAARRYFLCVAGAGPDGEMVHALVERLKQNTGILAYWLEGFRQLFRYSFPEILVKSEGRERKGTLVVVGRTKHYGGPFQITTEASLFEDEFEVMLQTTQSRWRYLMCLLALWLGKIRGMQGIEFWKTTEIECESAGETLVYAQMDGEAVGPIPLRMEIVPDALTLLLPAGYEGIPK